ncbi:MAG: Flp pilus assembly protein CpaB [Acidobacteria bacterium]|nr:Flp pilus assembly protein CpaB [Acidobacteriota bacterium]
MKAILVLALALAFGGLTAISIKTVLNRKNSTFGAAEPKRVVIAALPISLGARVSVEQLKVVEWPDNLLPQGTFEDPAKVVDRVAASDFTPGEAILTSRLAPEGTTAGLSAIIPDGFRAITVRVDEVIGVAGFIAPGTFVDLIATSVSLGNQSESNSRMILQNVKVLASGQTIETRESGKDGKPIEVKTVTLQVSPEQAEALALAATAGKIQLVMRNTTDQEIVQTSGTTAGRVFAGAGGLPPGTSTTARTGRTMPKPKEIEVASPAPPKNTIEMIRGTERSTVTFQ